MEVENNVDDELGDSLEEYLNGSEAEPEEEEIPREAEPSEPEEEEEPSSRKRQRPPAHERIQEIQREKYQLLNELERIKRENEELSKRNRDLDKRSNQAMDVASMFHTKSAELQLENARAKKLRARQEGDDNAEIEADIEIASAASALHQAKQIEAQKSLNNTRESEQEQEYRPQSQAQPQAADPAIKNYWLDMNANWFYEGGEEYDPELSVAVQKQAAGFEDLLTRNGMAHMIGSADYFREIDKYVANYRRQTQNQGRRELQMSSSRSNHVAPVRSGGGSSVQGGNAGKRPKLDRDELELIRQWDIKPEDYIKHRDKEIREAPYKRGNGYAGGSSGYSR